MIDTIAKMRAEFIAGTYTPTQAVEDAFVVIEEKDGEIHAFLDTYKDDALAQAAEATQRYAAEGEHAPELLGVPIALKNNILLKGKRATGGSKILENYTATYDATIVTKLKEAGAIIVGAAT